MTPNADRRETRAGLVGYRRGRQLAQHWQGVQGARLVAIADQKPELLAQAQQDLGPVETYPDLRDMLERTELDVLTIATTGQFHAQIVRDATAAGIKGIYCEKPMACSLTDADQMIADCAAAGTVLVIGHQRRWMEQIRRIRSAIKGGAIGHPTHGSVSWATARIGSNGTHFLDAISFMLDSPPVEVAGRIFPGIHSTKVEADEVFARRMEIDPGVLGFVTFADDTRIAIDCVGDVLTPFSYSFSGTRGRIELDERSWEATYWARDEDTRRLLDSRLPMPRRDFPPLAPYVDGVAEQDGFRELLRCVETGERPTSSGEDGRRVLEAIVGFHLSSAAGGQPVTLPLPESARTMTLTIH